MGFLKKLVKAQDPIKNTKAAKDGKWGNLADPMAESLGLYNPQDLIDGISGKSQEKAAKQAQRLRGQFADESMAFQSKQFDDSYERNRPFYEAGAAQLDSLADSATVSGMSDNLQRIMQDNAIGNIRNDAIAQNASALGLRGDMSGMGDVSAREAVTLEDMLNQRKQSLAGKALTSANNTAGIGQSTTNSMSNTLSGLGNSNFNSIMAQNAARQQGAANIANLGAGAFDYFRGSGGGGGSFISQPSTLTNQGMIDMGSTYSGQMPA